MRDKIRLVSTAGTGYFYTTTKNKRTMPEKMEIKKFDPKIQDLKHSCVKCYIAVSYTHLTLPTNREV